MDSKILLGKILQRFSDTGVSKVEGYTRFTYIKETNKAVHVTREKGKNTVIPFDKILKGIEAYQDNSDLFDEGPAALQKFGISHVTSPVWSLLHLLPVKEYDR